MAAGVGRVAGLASWAGTVAAQAGRGRVVGQVG